jgi:lipopolysaccharide/colanic/teichoic acid biosynthesis glycosyltransferase
MKPVAEAAQDTIHLPGTRVADERGRRGTAPGTGRNASRAATETEQRFPMPGASATESIMAGITGLSEVEFPRSYQIAKRLLDVVGAAIGLVILSPVFLIVSTLILLDSPGPVFFTQERVGLRGKPFRMLKFRTMAAGERLPQDGGPHKRRDDNLVARVGKFCGPRA